MKTNTKSDKILSFCVILLLLVSCLATLSMSIALKKGNQKNALLQTKLVDNMIESEAMKHLCTSIFELNNRGNEFLVQELIKLFPENYFKKDNLYVLFSSLGCSSCLSSLIEQVVRLGVEKEKVCIVLEEDNKYNLDECRAEGFSNVTFDKGLFEIEVFPEKTKVILVRRHDDHLFLAAYERGIPDSIIEKFLEPLNMFYYE